MRVKASYFARHGVMATILLCLLYWAQRTVRDNSSLVSRRRLANDQSAGIHYGSLIEETDLAFLPASIHDADQTPLRHGQSGVYYPYEFPKHIWQTSRPESLEKWANKAATWTKLNPDWEYHHLDDNQTLAFVETNFAHRPAIVHFYNALSDPILRADIFRYLALLARGGVYADIDTTALAPISTWIPPWLHGQHVNAIVGIEFDDEDDGTRATHWAVRPVSFCQWTLAAKPGHPIFQRAVRRVTSNLELLARLQRVELSGLKLSFTEVLAATGPGLMSDVVLEVLRDQLGNVTWESFHEQTQPMLYGDVLVLPINGFAGHQKHSHSGEEGYGEKLVQHHFGRSWYVRGKGDGVGNTRVGVD